MRPGGEGVAVVRWGCGSRCRRRSFAVVGVLTVILPLSSPYFLNANAIHSPPRLRIPRSARTSSANGLCASVAFSAAWFFATRASSWARMIRQSSRNAWRLLKVVMLILYTRPPTPTFLIDGLGSHICNDTMRWGNELITKFTKLEK